MVTRRAFLKSSGLAVVSLGLGFGPGFLRQTALAAAAPKPFGRRKTLVMIFQRGAMDGLMAVSPIGESRLRKLRPRLAMTAARSAGKGALIDLDGSFGLHPAFAGLAPFWKDGRLAIVHGVGSPDPTRSHFDAQDFMETGTPGRKGTPSGWLNRVVGELGHEASPFQAVSLTSAMPKSLFGPRPAIAVTNLRSFKLKVPGASNLTTAAGQGFEALYEQTSAELLRETGKEAFDAVRLLSDLELASYRPAKGVKYPRSPLGRSLRQIAMLIKGDVGLEVGFAETGGWDTHVQQGAAQGSFARRARDLGDSIQAFWTDLGQRRDDVVLMTATEFGRTVAENGSGGTDHGHASCLFVLGNQIDGGKVHGQAPNLAREALYEGRDLPVTTDFREVFSSVATGHLPVDPDPRLFPGWRGEPLPLFRSGS